MQCNCNSISNNNDKQHQGITQESLKSHISRTTGWIFLIFGPLKRIFKELYVHVLGCKSLVTHWKLLYFILCFFVFINCNTASYISYCLASSLFKQSFLLLKALFFALNTYMNNILQGYHYQPRLRRLQNVQGLTGMLRRDYGIGSQWTIKHLDEKSSCKLSWEKYALVAKQRSLTSLAIPQSKKNADN